jgi:peptide/nickel transport system permease protein
MRSVRSFFRQPLATTAFVIAAVIVLSTVCAGLIAPFDPLEQDLFATSLSPTGDHLLGTDTLGRDILSRLLFGGRVTLVGALIAVAVFVVLGVPLGLLAGYRGGLLDAACSRVVEILFAVPTMVIVLVVVSVFSGSIVAAMVTVGVLGSGSLFRVVRGQTMALAGELYVKAARSEGLRGATILRRHVLPNIWGPVIVQVSLFSAGAILTESGLAFLGFSVQPPDPSWGSMVGEASRYISAHPWQLVPPGALIGVIVMCLGLIGDGVRDSVTRSTRRTQSRRTSRPDSTTGPTPPPRSGALLAVRHLTIAFDGPIDRTVVVEDISFDVLPGETVGIVGESGSGKTVSARATIGLLGRGGRILSGQILFDGQDLTAPDGPKLSSIRGREIALIPQEPMTTLDPVFTIGQQVGEVVRQHSDLSRSEVKARVVELLGLVGLHDPEQLVKRYPHELSGGMAQRVGIALALAGNPRLLIADEPTTALDVTVQQQILDLLRSLQASLGMAIILVTHDWGVLADLCERATVMYAGHVVESADVVTLYHQPRHPYTRALIAANPHNAVKGEALASIPGQVPTPTAWPPGCHFAPRCDLATPECSAGPVPLTWDDADHTSRCLKLVAAGETALNEREVVR